MATFEVFVPVRGEWIVTVEADSAEDAKRQIVDGEVDYIAEGMANVEWADSDTEGFYAVSLDD